jgi:hypothetical protein
MHTKPAFHVVATGATILHGYRGVTVTAHVCWRPA